MSDRKLDQVDVMPVPAPSTGGLEPMRGQINGDYDNKQELVMGKKSGILGLELAAKERDRGAA